MDRRAFLGTIPVVALGASAGCRSEAAPAPARTRTAVGVPEALGVQLYTLRAVMDDPAATLAALAGMGYREVELAGLYGREPGVLRRMLDDAGLRAPSSHVALGRLTGDALAATLDEAEALGNRWLIVPSVPADHRSPDGFRRMAGILDAAGAAARERGVAGVGFHNHDDEFRPLDGGEPGLGILLAHTDPTLVSFQLDLFWTVHAGEDPLAWFAAHPGRWVSVHAKDRTAQGEMVAVGDGALDFAALLEAGAHAGVQHVFVEHDDPADPLDTVARSLRHLEGLRAAPGG